MNSENSIMRIFVESPYTFPESVLSVLSVLSFSRANHCFSRETTKRQKIWDYITFDHNARMACEDTLGNALDRYKKEAKGKID